MQSLPPEVQLDVLKCLTFDQIFSVKQTNFYFHNFISKYESGLARMKFNGLKITSIDPTDLKHLEHKIIDVESGIFDFTLNDRLEEKWQTSIDKLIPLALHDIGRSGNIFIVLERTKNEKLSYYMLKLPDFPKNIKEMIIIRCWLERLFDCAFECFYNILGCLFNPELINLLFDNDKLMPLKFHVQRPYIYFRKNIQGAAN